MIISKEQMAWLRGNLNFNNLSDMLQAARRHFVEGEMVPTLAVAGRTGAGKSSLINALAGRHVSAVGVIPTTPEVTEQEVEQGGVPLRVLDLPGVGEAGKHGERLENMLEQLDRSHVVLLAVPCPERSLDYECRLLEELRAHFAERVALPLLGVGTKIDCASPAREWNPHGLNLTQPVTEKERNIADWLGYAESVLRAQGVAALIPCACGEMHDDTDNQYGIPAIRGRIFDMLPDAARTYFARLTQDRQIIDKRAENIVRLFSGMASAAATQPLPSVPDAALIMPIQAALLVKLTRLHGKELTADMVTKLMGPLVARVAGRFAFEQLCKFIPGVGSVAGAAVAGGMTYALGMGYHTLLCDGNWDFDADALRDEVLKWWGRVTTSDGAGTEQLIFDLPHAACHVAR